jgi:hypothetical protein
MTREEISDAISKCKDLCFLRKNGTLQRIYYRKYGWWFGNDCMYVGTPSKLYEIKLEKVRVR